MVKRKHRRNRKKKQSKKGNPAGAKPDSPWGKKQRIARVGPNTPYGLCTERLSAFGGLLAFVKFLDLIDLEEVFQQHYPPPKRCPLLGHYRMIVGLVALLFVGFQRVGHLVYIREEPLICGMLKVAQLPVVSTFWRYLQSLRRMQTESLLAIMAAVRSRVWALVGYQPKRVAVNVDTTVATVYGKIDGARVGHNPKHRGKKALRPVLCFIEETREYLCGCQRRGETLTGKEVARQIRQFRKYLPGCVRRVVVRGDGEFIGWESVQACLEQGFEFIFGNRRCTPPFAKKGWYRKGKYEYNECVYQPQGWEIPCRFVVMRIRKKASEKDRQGWLVEDLEYTYRVFVTNLKSKPHQVIARYDPRADVENCIGEAQREGLLAIPSKKYQANGAFFQFVLFAYNLWRWMKWLAGNQMQQESPSPREPLCEGRELIHQTVGVARLKLLFLSAKVSSHGNREKVYYSIHESRAPGMIHFLEYLDQRRQGIRPWRSPPLLTSCAAMA